MTQLFIIHITFKEMSRMSRFTREVSFARLLNRNFSLESKNKNISEFSLKLII